MSLEVSAPQLLTIDHLLTEFDCGERSLDDWLKRRALSRRF
jgi:hypothetical protein